MLQRAFSRYRTGRDAISRDYSARTCGLAPSSNDEQSEVYQIWESAGGRALTPVLDTKAGAGRYVEESCER